jgi:hypothetical protein
LVDERFNVWLGHRSRSRLDENGFRLRCNIDWLGLNIRNGFHVAKASSFPFTDFRCNSTRGGAVNFILIESSGVNLNRHS